MGEPTLLRSPASDRLDRTDGTFYTIDPLKDLRWDDLLEQHSEASVFHSRAWLEALRRTYGFKSAALTTSAPEQPLRDAFVLCRVASRLTGRRLVSLPFSDHCDPLLQQGDDLQLFLNWLADDAQREQWRYLEFRPTRSPRVEMPKYHVSAQYVLHRLNLVPDLLAIYRGFHKDSIERKIRKAQLEGLRVQTGVTESSLHTFHQLLTITRRRRGVPPQPKHWFRNLVDCFGPALQILTAFSGQTPVATMLTLRHKKTLVYKYGGSDPRFHSLGSMHVLYWESIQQAKLQGLVEFDLGRTDLDQSGLITFKDRWGAARSSLNYWRFAPSGKGVHIFDPAANNWPTRFAKVIFSHTPGPVLSSLGQLLYKHIA